MQLVELDYPGEAGLTLAVEADSNQPYPKGWCRGCIQADINCSFNVGVVCLYNCGQHRIVGAAVGALISDGWNQGHQP